MQSKSVTIWVMVIVAVLGVLALCGSAQGESIIYVDADSPGNNDGSSWADAYNYLQDALAVATIDDEVWAAQGIYKPDQGGGVTPGDRTATFQLINGVTIRGGYAGFGEPDPNARNITAYESILSGDLDGNDVGGPSDGGRDENSYFVVNGDAANSTAILDGFTITAAGFPGVTWPLLCGGMRNDAGTIRNCTFSNNWGSGVRNNSGTITNCIFSNNESDDVTAGLYNISGDVTGCTFSNNKEMIYNYGGCGMYNSTGTVTNCIFSNNLGNYVAGGLYNESGDVNGCTFSNNTAWTFSGGLYNESGTVTNCTFTGNKGILGAGIDNGSGTVTNCVFAGNEAGWEGGGMHNYFGTVTNCVFTGNKSLNSDGGGMHNYFGIVTNCTFTGNQAAEFGGGMRNESGTIINCTFNSNIAGDHGGGMRNESGTITNCTFSGNYANKGGGLEIWGDTTVTITNCILWDNTPNEIYVSGSSTPVVTYCDVKGGFLGAGNINFDPLFVDTDTHNYHLLPGSPCIDAGDNTAVPADVTTDLDGTARFIDDPCTVDTGNGTPPVVDMGVYEYEHGDWSETFKLTVKVEPNDIGIDTLYPNIGQHSYYKDTSVDLIATRFVNCPNVRHFDHWEGDVADPGSAQTTVVIDMDKTVTGVFVDGAICGDECHPNFLMGDVNHDCIVDFRDIAWIASRWMDCTKPECD